MSKIIEQGNKVYECGRCGCKFALDGNDIIHHHHDIGDYSLLDLAFHDTEYCDYDYVYCPQCQAKVKLKKG